MLNVLLLFSAFSNQSKMIVFLMGILETSVKALREEKLGQSSVCENIIEDITVTLEPRDWYRSESEEVCQICDVQAAPSD